MILRGIFHGVSCFPLHFMLYRGNLNYFSDSEGDKIKWGSSFLILIGQFNMHWKKNLFCKFNDIFQKAQTKIHKLLNVIIVVKYTYILYNLQRLIFGGLGYRILRKKLMPLFFISCMRYHFPIFFIFSHQKIEQRII